MEPGLPASPVSLLGYLGTSPLSPLSYRVEVDSGELLNRVLDWHLVVPGFRGSCGRGSPTAGSIGASFGEDGSFRSLLGFPALPKSKSLAPQRLQSGAQSLLSGSHHNLGGVVSFPSPPPMY